jgi:zona occludens toxin (predicted ATPase)
LAKIRVPRKGVTQTELASVLSRRLGAEFQVAADGRAGVIARRSPLSAAVVRIVPSPGATVFRVRGIGMPVVSLGTARIVADALRRSPEFRGV